MLTGLKMPLLVRKFVFYRPKYEAKRGSHGTEF